MKRYRPYCAGYILLYGLTLLSLGDVIMTVTRTMRGTEAGIMGDFSLFAYLIFGLAACYTWRYIKTQVAMDDRLLRIAFPANLRPKEGQGRASFLFRQGDLDLVFIDKTFELKGIVRYGYVEDLGYERIDRSQAGEKNKLFPVHEVAFITGDNKRYHMNAAIYSARQRREIFTRIREVSGVEPEGGLAREIA